MASQPLADHEVLAMDLAWQSFAAGSVPVGAVLLDGGCRVVATGRSRMYERQAPPPELAGNLLAHAEVNALVRLEPGRRYEDHHLVTTLEPCPLCLGAASMATIGTLTYLGADPYGGAAGRLPRTAHTVRVPLRVAGPRDDPVGLLAAALHVACYLIRKPSGAVVRFHREHHPDLYRAGAALIQAGVDRLARDGRPWQVALPVVEQL